MTSDDYRRQLLAIGDAAAAEVDECAKRLARIRRAIADQRKRADNAAEAARRLGGFIGTDRRVKARTINSVLDAIERAMDGQGQRSSMGER